MARVRSLKPEFFDDEELATLSFPARLCFQGLWVWADRRGVVEDRPARLKARIFPFDDVNMDELLRELERGRFIVRYANGEYACIHIRTFEKHQHPHPKEQVSALPSLDDPGSVVTSPGKKRRAVESHGQSGGYGSGSGYGSGNGISSETLPRSEPAAPIPPPPPEPDGPTLLRFPTVGPEGTSWALSSAQVATWARLFPDLDIQGQCQAALAWVLAKPSRRKTVRGMPAFLVSWFGRSNDRRQSSPASGGGLVTRGERITQVNAASLDRYLERLTHAEGDGRRGELVAVGDDASGAGGCGSAGAGGPHGRGAGGNAP